MIMAIQGLLNLRFRRSGQYEQHVPVKGCRLGIPSVGRRYPAFGRVGLGYGETTRYGEGRKYTQETYFAHLNSDL
jgi:hypothetical protein